MTSRFNAPTILRAAMRRELLISSEPINEANLAASREASTVMGATICFSGIVRGTEAGEPIAGIRYEAFQKMAEHQFHLIFDAVETRWPVASIRLVHRIGFVKAGDPSLWVEVVAPHRGEAFAACQFLIEEMKRLVPIWKHPQTNPPH
jgi:molybdopterin synthase catalytic subunit